MSKRRGPIGWLFEAFQLNPVGMVCGLVLLAVALFFLGIAVHLMARGY